MSYFFVSVTSRAVQLKHCNRVEAFVIVFARKRVLVQFQKRKTVQWTCCDVCFLTSCRRRASSRCAVTACPYPVYRTRCMKLSTQASTALEQRLDRLFELLLETWIQLEPSPHGQCGSCDLFRRRATSLCTKCSTCSLIFFCGSCLSYV